MDIINGKENTLRAGDLSQKVIVNWKLSAITDISKAILHGFGLNTMLLKFCHNWGIK